MTCLHDRVMNLALAHTLKARARRARARSIHRFDPTRTSTLRRRYEREMRKRFREIARAIWQSIVEEDVLGITDPVVAVPQAAPMIRASARAKPKTKTPGRAAFKFDRDPKKVSRFMDFIKQANRSGIIGIQRGAPVSQAADLSWQNIYLRSAYQKGLANAGRNLKGQGVEVSDEWLDSAFFRPMHADRAGIIFTRAFSELEGVTATMEQRMSRTLARAITEGIGARATAKRLIDDVGFGERRAEMIARTETISAHAEASLNAYDEAELEGVQVEAEFITAQDDQVCPKCEELAGKTYPMDQARSIIPVHPNCRCAWLPVVDDPALHSLR